MLLSAFVTLFLSIFAAAVPFGDQHRKTCDTTSAKLVLPDGQTNLTAPTGSPSFVLLGVGYQNYTCSPAGTYTSAGALAFLFDLSCQCVSQNSDEFNKVPDFAFDFWSKSNGLETFPHKEAKLGEHFFQPNGNGGISPVWDFRGDAAPGQPDAFVVAAKVAGLAAPTGKQDVDWLQLRGVSGALATSIYRTHTRGGQPPATCTPGSNILSVKYVSIYWLYGSSITIS